jgi:DNA uptake protein ComE-like DNA-binding protein
MKSRMVDRGRWTIAVGLSLVVLAADVAPVRAQVGTSQGVVDVNVVPESELASMPGMTPAIAKAIVAKRPFSSITELNALLLEQGLTKEQATAFYSRAFVPIDLNTATSEEILLVPGAGRRMTHEFDEYRPWKSYAQFDKEIGKYVGPAATARLAQYTFIPMNANTASDADLQTIPGMTSAWLQAIKAGRPYKTVADVEAALAKASNPSDARRVARFLVVP